VNDFWVTCTDAERWDLEHKKVEETNPNNASCNVNYKCDLDKNTCGFNKSLQPKPIEITKPKTEVLVIDKPIIKEKVIQEKTIYKANSGKTEESLADSRLIREGLITYWGKVPSSIWQVDWSIHSKDLSKTYGEQQAENKEKYNDEFSLSGTGARHGALSRFPQDVCQFLIKFYSKENELVLDPFSGHNSRFESCYRLNRNYIGFDISHQFMQWNYQIREELYEENKRRLIPLKSTINLNEMDSRKLLEVVQKESADFCMTSPPFYDIEYYGDEPAQLGKCKTYDEFINELGQTVKACYEALKPGKFIAWEVNDFRRSGTFHVYHADTIKIFEAAGFKMHDVIIVDYNTAFLKCFLTDVEHNKIMPKQHSYIIVAKKKEAEIINKPNRQDTRERLLEEVKENPIALDMNNKQVKMF
jgi:DNA modification methylase